MQQHLLSSLYGYQQKKPFMLLMIFTSYDRPRPEIKRARWHSNTTTNTTAPRFAPLMLKLPPVSSPTASKSFHAQKNHSVRPSPKTRHIYAQHLRPGHAHRVETTPISARNQRHVRITQTIQILTRIFDTFLVPPGSSSPLELQAAAAS